ncbi:YdaU family protein [Psychrobacter sp. T6-6]|uniref:YdaU family protein n=1 Tax=Psychrobacter sp. T6-6 TaxID=3457452 RepID=UPI003FD091B9
MSYNTVSLIPAINTNTFALLKLNDENLWPWSDIRKLFRLKDEPYRKPGLLDRTPYQLLISEEQISLLQRKTVNKKVYAGSIDFIESINTFNAVPAPEQGLASYIASSKSFDYINLNQLAPFQHQVLHFKSNHNIGFSDVLGKVFRQIMIIGAYLMHYFPFSPKDYMSKTSFLEPMEDLAYRRMLDYCYLNEQPLPKDITEIALLISMRTHSDSIAVVLHYFFELTDDGYINDRVERDIKAYQEKSVKARASARARWDEKKSKISRKEVLSERNANACKTHDGRNTNYKLLTINEELETNSNSANQKQLNIPFDLFWKTYAKSVAKGKCESKWSSLSNKVREQIMLHLPAYITSTPVKKFRKDPYTYLNNECWLDDIIANEPRINQQAATYSDMNVNAKYDDPNHNPLGGLFTVQGSV